jgi:hypothetical protein
MRQPTIRPAETEANEILGRARDGTSSDPPALPADEPSPHSMFAWQARERSP